MDNQNLRDNVIDAFSTVFHPGKGNIIGHECEECYELRDTFSSLKWDAVPPDIIDDNFGQMPLFTPEAYTYFLPAYLLRCLDNFNSDNLVCEFVIYSLTYDDTKANETQWIAARHNLT